MRSYMATMTARKLAESLKMMHKNYLSEGIIYDPLDYQMNHPELFHPLRNLCYHGILIPLAESAFMWAGGEYPDYEELACQVIES